MTTAATGKVGPLGRLWGRYLVALRERPIRTKMITSGGLYVVGDWIAQFGIEGRSLSPVDDEVERYDVSLLFVGVNGAECSHGGHYG
jgi:protein Mpv17